MTAHANTIATWASILALMLGGGIWVGSIASDVSANKEAATENKQQLDKLRNDGPPAIARLESQMRGIENDMAEIKQAQQELLKEIRKK